MKIKRSWYSQNADIKSPDTIHQVLMYGDLKDITSLKNQLGNSTIKNLFVKHPKKIYTINELYSYLQDLFDEPKYMKYEVPIVASSKKTYSLINGWTMDENSRQYLKGGTLISSEP